MGRLIAFLADMVGNVSGTPRSIAASKNTAVDISAFGNATIVADPGVVTPMAYFVTPPDMKPNVNQPLNWQGISVIRVAAGGTFDLNNWTVTAGLSRKYSIDAINGLLAVKGNNDYY